MKFDHLVSIFNRKQFGPISQSLSIENVMKRYCLFPNEAIYIVDYKTSEVEFLTKNQHKVTGMNTDRWRDINILYEHVHQHSLTSFVKYTEQLLQYGFDGQRNFFEEEDFSLNLYKTIHDHVILKSTTVLCYDASNLIRYSVGKLMDVTGMIPYHKFGYKFTGPSSSKVYARFNGIFEFTGLLTPRELEILKLTGSGFNSIQVANQLFISRHTVDTHKRNIIRKLEASNSLMAYNKAMDMGIIS